MTDMKHDFRLERRLRRLNPELHSFFADTVFAMRNGLTKYQLVFPEFTDHTVLHSMNVIGLCNRLAGDRTESLNEDEIYILLMGCYLHDTGMGITRKDYREFSGRVDFGDYFETHSRDDIPAVIRSFHHEFSGQFIRKYAGLFEIPSPEHIQAIVQVSRGHRKTDLMDEREYPADFRMPNGRTACLPYLAALIRLADEIDVAADRNPELLHDLAVLTDERQIIENKKVRAVRRLLVTESAFTLEVRTAEKEIREEIRELAVKIQNTLDYCRTVVQERTPFTITQESVLIQEENA